ncbi:NfeD family protein [Halothiobacillus sp. DCM-1]|uniref:NfeD family protein n=1 Tax=Halothiobacillus sp. DCM-1 TaxID=3112558 RepID=UPI0032567485
MNWDYWGWWILGLLLIVVEIFAPSSFFLWLGVAALAVGGIAFVLPSLIWPIEIALFAALSIIALLIGRRLFRPQRQTSDRPTLNKRGDQYLGRQFTLEAPIVNGVGWLHIGDSRWRVIGTDTPAGAQVTVTGVEGASLVVRPSKSEPQSSEHLI